MIISPPFIPSPIVGETDDAFLARAMVGGIPGDGGFPLSFDLNWHGGMHLTAPQENGSALPVRAISDGIIAYIRNPTPESTDPNHPLGYRGGWTHDGCVVLRHETEIGEGEKSKVIFFSIYMHLSKIFLANPQKGVKVYRKECIGEAGSIYGKKESIHFEIIADDSQIENIVGRKDRDLTFKTSNGRKDSFWGNIYFFIPPEVLAYETAPTSILSAQNASPIVYRCPAAPSGQSQGGTDPAPAIDGYDAKLAQALQEGMIVRMNYWKGECTLTTYTLAGSALGSVSEKPEYEYKLFKTANDNFPLSPSAGFELLRFGRVLGPDALNPAGAAHWRRIKLPDKIGQAGTGGWVNLNALTVTKFSDADFPHWEGWQLIDDDSDKDSHCQSQYIRELLGLNKSAGDAAVSDIVGIASSTEFLSYTGEQKKHLLEKYTAERACDEAALKIPDNQSRLKRLVCKFPSEWSKNDFDDRYGWLLKVAENGPMSQEDYSKVKSHQQALGFWEEAAIEGINSKHWHFSPREFVRTFRSCWWLSAEEMAQCLPKKLLYLEGSVFTQRVKQWATVLDRAKRWAEPFNKAVRKYGVASNSLRVLHLLANTVPETDYLRLVRENGAGTASYSPYWGRGLIQLTGLDLYKKYGKFRCILGGVVPQGYIALGWDPDAVIARNNTGDHNYYNCADTACFYVVSKSNMLKHMDLGADQSDATTIGKYINGFVAIENLNGLELRLQAVAYMRTILTDFVNSSDEQIITFEWRRNTHKEPVIGVDGNPVMEGNPPHVKKKFYRVTHTIQNSLERQRP